MRRVAFMADNGSRLAPASEVFQIPSVSPGALASRLLFEVMFLLWALLALARSAEYKASPSREA